MRRPVSEPSVSPNHPGVQGELVLKESANVRVGESRIGCGNLWEREYTLPDGSTRTGMSARIHVASEVLYVGAGSEFVADGQRYRVVAIDKEPNVLGRVRIERIAI